MDIIGRKNLHYNNLKLVESRNYHKLLESQLVDLSNKEIKSRFEASILVLKEMSKNKIHRENDDFINEDINFLKANGYMYFLEYVKRTEGKCPRLKKGNQKAYFRNIFGSLSNYCGPFDYVNIKSRDISAKKFLGVNPFYDAERDSLFANPGLTRIDGISTFSK